MQRSDAVLLPSPARTCGGEVAWRVLSGGVRVVRFGGGVTGRPAEERLEDFALRHFAPASPRPGPRGAAVAGKSGDGFPFVGPVPGLNGAVACGYGLLRIELLVALARIRLAWPDTLKAIQAAREALDLAAHPDCGYAWGEADAAQAWGEAFFANSELALAQRAFTRALEVRRRIKHPGASETERWLARTV